MSPSNAPSPYKFNPYKYEDTGLFHRDVRIFVEALDGCKMEKVGDTDMKFVWNSLTEQTPPTPHYLTPAVARLMAFMGRDIFEDADTLNSEEDRGAILAQAVSDVTKLPLTLSRWSTPNDSLPSTEFSMEYASGNLYFYGINGAPQRLAIVDDLISTGGTMCAQATGIRERVGKTIAGIILAADKGYGGAERLEQETGIKPIVLAQLDLTGDRSHVEHLHFDAQGDLLKNIRRDLEKVGPMFISNETQKLITTRLD